MFEFEAVLMCAYGKVRSDDGMDVGFKDFGLWRKEGYGSICSMLVGVFAGLEYRYDFG